MNVPYLGQSSLHLAVDDPAIIQMLIDHGALIDEIDNVREILRLFLF